MLGIISEEIKTQVSLQQMPLLLAHASPLSAPLFLKLLHHIAVASFAKCEKARSSNASDAMPGRCGT